MFKNMFEKCNVNIIKFNQLLICIIIPRNVGPRKIRGGAFIIRHTQELKQSHFVPLCEIF